VRRLPPGPHGLPPELVERNQRERLIAAMAEVCAERGYGAASVADIAKQAGVSTASFYRQFKDKRECMLACFEELFGRLLAEVERSCDPQREPSTRRQIAVRTAADLLASDLPTARLLSIEILAVGSDGVKLQHEAIDHMAAQLRQPDAVAEPGLPDTAWTATAAMVALVGKRLAQGRAPASAELEVIAASL
jgi:AcrR family transcriptional regulator